MLRRRSNGSLPLATGGKPPPTHLRQILIPQFTATTFFSWGWSLFAMLTLLGGVWHCNRHSHITQFQCAEKMCTLSQEINGVQRNLERFPHDRLVKAEVVQLKGGQIYNGRRGNRKKRPLPQTYAVTWKNKDGGGSDTTTVPITTYGLGRKILRKQVSEIMRYVRSQKEELDIEERRWLSSVGLVCFVFGGLLLLMRLAVGDLRMKPPPSKPSRARSQGWSR
ncbi:unnamed protein product [Discosporangium mesarthrocarpum]